MQTDDVFAVEDVVKEIGGDFASFEHQVNFIDIFPLVDENVDDLHCFFIGVELKPFEVEFVMFLKIEG